jgi:UDP-N-acetylglucosamine acyltransferase
VRIGNGNYFDSGVVLGSAPEHSKIGVDEITGYLGEGVEIGGGNIFREQVAVNSGLEGRTRIGNANLFQRSSHVGHDSIVAHNVTVSTFAALGGHSLVASHATVGMHSAIHQRATIDFASMIGMGTAVRGRVPPFTTVNGNPMVRLGLNSRKVSYFLLTRPQIRRAALGQAFIDLLSDDQLELDREWRASMKFFS